MLPIIPYIEMPFLAAPLILYFWYIDKKFNGNIPILYVLPITIYALISIIFVSGYAPYSALVMTIIFIVVMMFMKVGSADKTLFTALATIQPILFMFLFFPITVLFAYLDKKHRLQPQNPVDKSKLMANYILIGFVVTTFIFMLATLTDNVTNPNHYFQSYTFSFPHTSLTGANGWTNVTYYTYENYTFINSNQWWLDRLAGKPYLPAGYNESYLRMLENESQIRNIQPTPTEIPNLTNKS